MKRIALLLILAILVALFGHNTSSFHVWCVANAEVNNEPSAYDRILVLNQGEAKSSYDGQNSIRSIRLDWGTDSGFWHSHFGADGVNTFAGYNYMGNVQDSSKAQRDPNYQWCYGSGCGAYASAHAAQWVSGHVTSDGYALVSDMLESSHRKDPWDAAGEGAYNSYICSYGNAVATSEFHGKHDGEKMYNYLVSGGCIVLGGNGHYILAVGAKRANLTGTEEIWFHIVDSYCWSTMNKIINKGTEKPFNFSMTSAINSMSNAGGEYWLSYNAMVAIGLSCRYGYKSKGGSSIPSTEVNAESLQFQNITYPLYLNISTAGWVLSSGYLTSNAELTYLRSEIVKPNGDSFSIYETGLSGHSFYIPSINSHVSFSEIARNGYGEGTYTWRLTGKDSWGRTIVLNVPINARYNISTSTDVAKFIGPRKPNLSVVGSDDMHETALNWNATDETTYYDLRIWNSAGTLIYGKQNFSSASSPNALMILDAGSYTANVASVYTGNGSGTWVYSDTVSFTVSIASKPTAVAPIKHKEYNHKLYQLYQKECTWREAKYLAAQSGGTFVTITSQGEQDAVAQLVSEGGFNTWLGAEAMSGYTWSWVSDEAWNYTKWNSGEPNGSNGKENCAVIYASSGFWNDTNASASDAHGFIIEYDPVGLVVNPKSDIIALDKVISKEDLEVDVTFKDGTTITTDDYIFTLSGTDAGEQTITVKYGDLTASTNVTVGGSRIVLSDSEITLVQKDSRFDLSATLYTTEMPVPSLNWSCIHSGDDQWDNSMYFQTKPSNPNIVTIGPDVRTGDYIVTCETSDGKASASCIVTVLPAPVTGINLGKTSLSMHVNDQTTLSASVLPDYTTDNGVTWSSSNDNVASVVSGNVYANGVGTATITCAAESNPAMKATCTVTVSKPVSAVILNYSVYEFGSSADNSIELHATIVPEDATNKTVEWNSSSTAVATVTNGIVRPVAPGYTRITCSSVDGPVGICDVVVHADKIMHLPVALKEIKKETFYGSSVQEVILPEGAMTIESKAFANCDRLSLVYIPSSVASIASDAFENSSYVAIISDGFCTATQYAQNKGIPYVISSMPEEVLVISNDSTLSVGRTMKLYSYVQPDNAPQVVKWSILEGTSNAAIEAYGDECTLTASGVGHVTVAATAINGITGTADISIIEHATEFAVWFDANGGTCDTSYLNARFDEALGMLPVPTRDYHKFEGWYTSANDGSKVTASTVFDDYDMGDITLYAHWTPQTCTITFDANGGTCTTESIVINRGETLGSLPTATRAYYRFLGWFLSPTSNEQIDADYTVFSEDRTIYAKWELKGFGNWSDWSTTPVTGTENREVQTEVRSVQTGSRTKYNYRRYIYWNSSAEQWWATYTEYGSNGQWQYATSDSPFTPDGVRDGNQRYNGERRDGTPYWYFETITAEPIYSDVTYYRYRDRLQ